MGNRWANVFGAGVFVLWSMLGAAAQEFGAIARIDPKESHISDGWFSGSTIELHLSHGVPFRVFHLENPDRLVLDIRQVDWGGATVEDFLKKPGHISALRFGRFQGGWSRMIFNLAQPMLPREVSMPVDQSTGRAVLTISLEAATKTAFAKGAGAPDDTYKALVEHRARAQKQDDEFLVVIDPGHGGIDPGAIRDGVQEKDLMLTLARGLAEALIRSGQAKAHLTRNDDRFISLPGRVKIAHDLEADLFVSLHADALENGQASGATVYTLADRASDAASQQLAEQHARSDIIAGVDLSESDDQVAGILMDLARLESKPRNDAIADLLVQMIEEAAVPLSKKGRKEAGFSVLSSADIPSVLIEVGFLSNAQDRANLKDPIWRETIIEAMVDAILSWRADDLATDALVRQ